MSGINPPVSAGVSVLDITGRVRETIVKNITKGPRWLLLDLSKEPTTILPGPELAEADWRKARRAIEGMADNQE